MTQRFYKWKPDVPDHRDHKFSLAPPAVVPDHVDPLGLTNLVEDQGKLGSCTGNSTTTALEISLNSKVQYSRLMAYYHGRMLEDNVKNDDGAQIRDVIKGIQLYGVAQESMWPYDVTKFAEKPSPAAYEDGKHVLPLIDKYERLNNINEVQVALVAGLGVSFGFCVPSYFESPEMAKLAWIRMPTMFDKMVGGHAVTAIGYDTRGKEPFVWVRNSWGPAWGINGNFKMPFEWFTDDRRLVDDMWVMYPKK